jgi:hypothetical protein
MIPTQNLPTINEGSIVCDQLTFSTKTVSGLLAVN